MKSTGDDNFYALAKKSPAKRNALLPPEHEHLKLGRENLKS